MRLLWRYVLAVFIAGQLLAPVALAAPGEAEGLEITPPVVELEGNPGRRVDTVVKFRNITKNSLTVYPVVNDFTAAGEDGKPALLMKPGETTPFSMKAWIAKLPQLTLAAGELKDVNITINIPANATPGGHYAVVRYSATPPEVEGSGVGLSASIGSLLLLRVGGKVVDKLTVSDFFATQNGTRQSFFQKGPITYIARIKNDGNGHNRPMGSITVTGGIFGKKVVDTIELNPTKGNVLPGTIRKFEHTSNKPYGPGRYQAKILAAYGPDNQQIEQVIYFWVIPIQTIGLAILIIVLLVLFFRFYNKMIIKRASKRKR